MVHTLRDEENHHTAPGKKGGIFPGQTTTLGRIKLLFRYQIACVSTSEVEIFKNIYICMSVYIQRLFKINWNVDYSSGINFI